MNAWKVKATAAAVLLMMAVAAQAQTTLGTGASAESGVAIGDNATQVNDPGSLGGVFNGIAIGGGAYSSNGGISLGDNARSDASTWVTPDPLLFPFANAGIAIGLNALSSSDSSIGIGTFAVASGWRSSAIGWGATAFGESAQAWGDRSQAFAYRSLSFGTWATTQSGQSQAIGDFAFVGSNSTGGLAMGSLSRVGDSAFGGVAIGLNALVQDRAQSAIAIGQLAVVQSDSFSGVAIGPGATVGAVTGAVAIGAESVANADYTVSVGNTSGLLRRITSVGDGINTNDAVNFGQLSALTSSLTNLDARVSNLESAGPGGGGGTVDAVARAAAAAAQADATAALTGSAHDQVARDAAAAASGGGGGGVVGTEDLVARAAAAAAQSSANTALSVATAVEDRFNRPGFRAGAGAVADDVTTGAIAIGGQARAESSTSVAIGSGARAVSSVAVGAQSLASGTETVAIGDRAQALGNNSVALGSDTTATEANTVAVGNRRIVQVADGTAAGDAVNVGQLRAVEFSMQGAVNIAIEQSKAADEAAQKARERATEAINLASDAHRRIDGITASIDKVDRRASAGIAGALALSGAAAPNSMMPGEVHVGAGVGTWNGQLAMAVQAARAIRAANGREVVMRAGVTASGEGSGFSAGVSMRFK